MSALGDITEGSFPQLRVFVNGDLSKSSETDRSNFCVGGGGSLSENIDFCTTCDLSSCNAESADVRGLEPDLTFCPRVFQLHHMGRLVCPWTAAHPVPVRPHCGLWPRQR